MIRTLTAAAMSGLLLQLASSPFEWWWVSGFALTPALLALRERGGRDWLITGLVIGFMNGACIVDAGAKWGAFAVLFFSFFVAALHAIPFAGAGWLAPRFSDDHRPMAFVVSWLLFVWCIDEFIYTPVLLAAPLALYGGIALDIVRSVGIVGLEGVVVGMSAGLACGGFRSRFAVLASVAIFAVVSSSLSSGNRETLEEGRLVGVQPNIHWMDFAASGWSIDQRQRIERTLDRMTEKAARVAGQHGTVVWPENGNSLPNAQLQRRRRKLASILSPTGADLLAPGRELSEGREYLSVFRFDGRQVTARARKANLLPVV
ncbi:MAG: hypothetical protein AAF449_08730, partial [Myxococcota bacterium]